MNKEDIICKRKCEIVSRKNVRYVFGSIYTKRIKIEQFLHRKKTNTPIPANELEKHDVALFQPNHLEHGFEEYTLSDIMVDFEIDKEHGEITARKLYYYNGRHEIETRTYYIENYGKTWIAWAALPTREAARRWWA